MQVCGSLDEHKRICIEEKAGCTSLSVFKKRCKGGHLLGMAKNGGSLRNLVKVL